MKKLYFIRHGQSVLNVQGKLAGTTETPLTDEGRAQAKATGQLMKTQGIMIDFVAASPLSRAHETAQIVAKEIGYDPEHIHTNQLLAERHYGELEGQPWAPDLNLDGFSDVEMDDALVARAHLALKWLKSIDADNILIVSHGGFGRAIRSITLTDFPMHHYKRISNAELIELV
ncbi:histidine phosphatase family protein [Candidatus Saccharibacteria bacterium]|nr:histidine phosphatase family protein [Candidatus Saccharibacteria bacterium]